MTDHHHRTPFQEPFAAAAAELERTRSDNERLLQENAELRQIARGTINAGNRLQTARIFYLFFAALFDDERKDLVLELKKRFCLACGGELAKIASWCRCQIGEDPIEEPTGGEGG